MRSPWGRAAVAVALLTTLASTARADALADARKAVEGSDYSSARPALETALKAGTAGPADLAEIYKLTGIVEAALGNAGPSEKAFAKWLALDPKASLPPGTSPKITRPFSAAQERAKKTGPLAAKAETADDPPSVTLVVVSDPQKMIVGAKVYYVADRKPEQTLSADGKDKITIDLDLGKRIDLRLHAIDEYGNRVVELGSKDVPIVITSSGKAKPLDTKDRALLVRKQPSEPPQPRPWYFQWWVWGATTVVATGVGGYFAWRTREDVQQLDHLNANSLDYQWHDAQVVEDSARRNLLVTNIAAGTAGVFAIGTVILYLTRPTSSEPELRATITPTRGGGAVSFGGQF
ncbi:MAG TPA: tetratricopeptide repeat protein [Kofleriaceae bacterium]